MAEPLPGRARLAWLSGVRARTTLVAAAVVALGLIIGAVALVGVMRAILTDEVASTAEATAAQLAATLAAGDEPALSTIGDADEAIAQLLDEDGRVIASSPGISGLSPVADISPGETVEIASPITEVQAPFVVVADTAETADGRVQVLVGRALDDVVEATQVVAGLLAVGLPILLALVVLVTWGVVGRALSPVEAIRREVEAISATELHRRVPQPAGHDEIGRLASTMNSMLGRLQDARGRQLRFISDASHELRSPVAAIRQHAEVALAHPESSSTVELAEPVLAEGLRIQRLVDDLLLLARSDEHTLRLTHHEVDLDDLVLEESRRVAATTTLRVDVSAVSAGRVLGDDASLGRLLRNLGENAARHARSLVAFSLRSEDGAVVLGIDDDGPGIPTEARERVFERFVRLDEARARDGGGSGLGLAIVAEVVAAHGGSVKVQDSPLGGTRIEVRIPHAP